MLRTATLAIGAALLIILIWRLGPQEILAALRQIGPYAAVVIPLYAAHHATRALALRTCVLPPTTLGYIEAVAIRLSGEAVQVLTVTGPVLAEPTQAWLRHCDHPPLLFDWRCHRRADQDRPAPRTMAA